MNSLSLVIILTHNNGSASESSMTKESKSTAPGNAVGIGCCYPEVTDKINHHGSVGALMRSDKIENARSVAITIREQRQQEHQTFASASMSTTSLMRNALMERLEVKLLANDMEFTELERLVDAWKGGVPAALLLLHCEWEPEVVLGLRDENDLFQTFEATFRIQALENLGFEF